MNPPLQRKKHNTEAGLPKHSMKKVNDCKRYA
jgi:hypothetical protein